jgi:hypothetical protein
VFPGSIFDVEVNLKNVGEEPADSISLGLEPKYPLTSIGNVPSSYINTLEPQQKASVNFTLGLDKSADAKLYEVGVRLEYFSKNVLASANESFGVMVQESLGILDISNITTRPETIAPGDVFDIDFAPRNLGSESIDGINLRLLPKPPFASIGGAPEAYISTLKPNEGGLVKFNMNVDRIAPTKQFYPMDFEVQYSSRNIKFTKNGSFGIVVKGGPAIYIQEIIVEPTKLEPSTEGLMMVRVINTGTERAEDIKISISGGDNILTESFNFIGGLEINNLETTSFGIFTNPMLTEGKHELNIDIDYKDRYGNSYNTRKPYEVTVFESDKGLTYFIAAGGLIGFSLVVFLIIVSTKSRSKD